MTSVLLVDDEQIILDIGKLFLEQSGGLSVRTAISVNDALQLMKNETFDAIVSDYQMPKMNGLEFLLYIRKRSDVPFIIFTGRGREEIVIEAMNNGANFYVQKGGDPRAQFAELAHKIKRATKIPTDQSCIIRFGSENFIAALDCFYKAVENNPEIKKIVSAGLIDLIKNGQIVEAIQFCDRELFANPKLSEIWLIKAFLTGIGEKNIPGYSHEIFISHSIEDKEIANLICSHLEEEGIKCWIAPRDISPTRIWSEEIPQAIQGAKILILILSKSSNISDNVLREIVLACQLDKKIVPVRVEKIDPSDRLQFLIQIWQFIDIYKGDFTENTHVMVKQLKTELTRL